MEYTTSSSESQECCATGDSAYNVIKIDEFDYEVVKTRSTSCCDRPTINPCVFTSVVIGAICIGIITGVLMVWFAGNTCVPDLPPVAAALSAVRGRTCVKSALIYPHGCYTRGIIIPRASSTNEFAALTRTWIARFNELASGYTAVVTQKRDHSASLIIVVNTTGIASCTRYSAF